mgnify:CR=1 FL=1
MSIVNIVNGYFKFRNYKEPDTTQAFLFLTSEVGELADKLVHVQSEDWVRNHPENKNDDIAGEIGDVLMMLTKTAATLGLDPIDCMLEKMERKGFNG